MKSYTQLLQQKETARRAHPRSRDRCIRGHPFAGGNLYLTPHGERACRICQSWRQGARRERLRERIGR